MVNGLKLLTQIFAGVLARQRAEKSRYDSEFRLRLAADSANAGLWTLETASGRVWATDKTKELFGFGPKEEFNLAKFLSIVHLEDRDSVRETLAKSMQSGAESGIEYRIIRADGEIRWISTRGRRRSGEFGEPDQLMGVSIDITETKRVQMELQNSYAEVKRLEERLQAEIVYLREEIKEIGRFHAGDKHSTFQC